MTRVERIKTMLLSEEQTIERERDEVTRDPALVEAEIRAGCLREVINILEPEDDCARKSWF